MRRFNPFGISRIYTTDNNYIVDVFLRHLSGHWLYVYGLTSLEVVAWEFCQYDTIYDMSIYLCAPKLAGSHLIVYRTHDQKSKLKTENNIHAENSGSCLITSGAASHCGRRVCLDIPKIQVGASDIPQFRSTLRLVIGFQTAQLVFSGHFIACRNSYVVVSKAVQQSAVTTRQRPTSHLGMHTNCLAAGLCALPDPLARFKGWVPG